MQFKIWGLCSMIFFLFFAGCSDQKKEREYEELDRMADTMIQTQQHQEIADDVPLQSNDGNLR